MSKAPLPKGGQGRQHRPKVVVTPPSYFSGGSLPSPFGGGLPSNPLVIFDSAFFVST